MELELDHLVLAASTLDEGVRHVCALLGVREDRFSAEGKHADFGTHNRCLALDYGEGSIYLEVLALDPSPPAPPKHSHFGMSSPEMQARLAEQGPRLLTFVVRCADLDAAAAAHPTLVPPPVSYQRGEYRWRLGVPAHGGLPDGCGVIPTLIQWDEGSPTPAKQLPRSALRLLRFTACSKGADVANEALTALGASKLLKVSQSASAQWPTLVAGIWAPVGLGHTVRTVW